MEVILAAPNTLSHYSNSGVFLKRDISEALMGDVLARLDTYMDWAENDQKNPDLEALSFYCKNHIYSLCSMRTAHRDAPLGVFDKYVRNYTLDITSKATRAFYYLLLICARESRHNNVSGVFFDNISTAKCATLLKKIADTTSAHHIVSMLRNPPSMFKEVSLGAFTHGMARGFYEGNFSGGYGGKPWGDVATCLNNFVNGVYTGEMMLDTVWTLCHNNGPIFNKGMLYTGHSKDLSITLDVQRAGMIPSLIMDVGKFGVGYLSHIPMGETKQLQKFFDLIEEPIPHVDWDTVKALGAIKSYSAYKQMQISKFGSSSMKDAQEGTLIKHKLAEAKKHEQEYNEKYYVVSPTCKVEKINRKESNA